MERTKYQILRTLKKKPMSFWELIRSQDSTLSEATRTIGLMLAENQIAFDQKSQKFSLQERSGILAEDDGLCPTCQGKGSVHIVMPCGDGETAILRLFVDIADKAVVDFKDREGARKTEKGKKDTEKVVIPE